MATRTLIDTSILVYRYDARFPDKQSIAEDLLRDGIASGSARIAHQALVEFVAAVTRGGPESWLLEPSEARREAEEPMAQFPVIYPDDAVLRTALRGAAAYGPGLMRTCGRMPKSTGSRNWFPRISGMVGCTALSP